MIKHLLSITSLLTVSLLTACTDPQEATLSVDPSMDYGAFEALSKKDDAKITQDGDWTVITRMVKGNRVYWFVAPDVNKVSPALFKKTIHLIDKNKKETITVSKCEAPKKTCDNLMEEFKTMSESYK